MSQLSVPVLHNVEYRLKEVTNAEAAHPRGHDVVSDILAILEPLRTEDLQTWLENDISSTKTKEALMRSSLVQTLGASLDLVCNVGERVYGMEPQQDASQKATLSSQVTDAIKAILNIVYDFCDFAGSKAKKVYGREFIQRFLHMMSLSSLSAAPDDLRQTVQTLLFLVQLCHENQRSMTDWLKAQEVLFWDHLVDCKDMIVQLDLLEILYRCGRQQLQSAGEVTVLDGSGLGQAVAQQYQALVHDRDKIPGSSGHLAKALHDMAECLNKSTGQRASIHTFIVLQSNTDSFHHPDASEQQLGGKKSGERLTVNHTGLLYTVFTDTNGPFECLELEVATPDVASMEMDMYLSRIGVGSPHGSSMQPAHKLVIKLHQPQPQQGISGSCSGVSQSVLGASGELVLWISPPDASALKHLLPDIVCVKTPKMSIATLNKLTVSGSRSAAGSPPLNSAAAGAGDGQREMNAGGQTLKRDSDLTGAAPITATGREESRGIPSASHSPSCAPDSLLQVEDNPSSVIPETQEEAGPPAHCAVDMPCAEPPAKPQSHSCHSSSQDLAQQQVGVSGSEINRHPSHGPLQTSSNLSDIVCAQKSLSDKQGAQATSSDIDVQQMSHPAQGAPQVETCAEVQIRQNAPQEDEHRDQTGHQHTEKAQPGRSQGAPGRKAPGPRRITRAMKRNFGTPITTPENSKRQPVHRQVQPGLSLSDTSDNDAIPSMVAQENYEFDSSVPFDSGPAGRPMDQAEGADDKTATRRKGVLGKLQGRSAAQKETQREADEAAPARGHEGTPVTPKDATEHFQRTHGRKIEDTAMQSGRKKPVPRARSGRRTTGNKYLRRSAAASKLHITSTLESVQGGQEQAKPTLASKASARRRQANADLQLEEKARYRQPSPASSEDPQPSLGRPPSEAATDIPNDDAEVTEQEEEQGEEDGQHRADDPLQHDVEDNTDDEAAGLEEEEAKFQDMLSQLQQVPGTKRERDSGRKVSPAEPHQSLLLSFHAELSESAAQSDDSAGTYGQRHGITQSKQGCEQHGSLAVARERPEATSFDDAEETATVKNAILQLLEGRKAKLAITAQAAAKDVERSMNKLLIQADKQIADARTEMEGKIRDEYATVETRLQKIYADLEKAKETFEATVQDLWKKYAQVHQRMPAVKRKAEGYVDQQKKFARTAVQSAEEKALQLLAQTQRELDVAARTMTDVSDVRHCLDSCQTALRQ